MTDDDIDHRTVHVIEVLVVEVAEKCYDSSALDTCREKWDQIGCLCRTQYSWHEVVFDDYKHNSKPPFLVDASHFLAFHYEEDTCAECRQQTDSAH